MKYPTRTRAAAAALALGLAALCVILMLTALHGVGTDRALYYSEQMEAGILPGAGISEAELAELDGRLADYLRGNRAALENNPPFNDREMAHMADCFGLFTLLRKVRGRLVPWAVFLIAGGAWLLRDRRRARRCAWLAPLLVLLPLGAFALFAAVNFDAAFALFHRVLFKNDLWLLDPATDLLIRICPQRMFMHMGARIAVYSLAGMLALSALATLMSYLWPREKGRNAWKRTTGRAPAPRQYDFGSRGRR